MGKTRDSANLVSDKNITIDIVNDRVGIGSTVPTSKLQVIGDGSISGVITATTFNGNIVGTAATFTGNVSSGGLTVSGVTTVAAGSTSAPSVSPTGDNNTGIFFPSADTIAFAEGGVEVLRVNSSGNVGLGTNNPGSKLDVNGEITIRRTAVGDEGGQINFARASDNTVAWNIDAFGSTSTPSLRFIDSIAAAERFRLGPSGQLGVAGANYGSSGQVLTSGGASAAPSWSTPSSGALVYISSVTASNSPSVAFTSGIDSTYDVYVVIARNVIPVNDQLDLYMRTSSNGGSSYDSGASDYYAMYAAVSSNSTAITVLNAGATDKIFVEYGGTDNDSGYGGLNFTMHLYNPSSSSTRKFVQIENVNAYRNDPIVRRAFGGGFRNSTSAINAIQYYFSSGNISSGVFRLYGIKNS